VGAGMSSGGCGDRDAAAHPAAFTRPIPPPVGRTVLVDLLARAPKSGPKWMAGRAAAASRLQCSIFSRKIYLIWRIVGRGGFLRRRREAVRGRPEAPGAAAILSGVPFRP
jgi:hypothetical protein